MISRGDEDPGLAWRGTDELLGVGHVLEGVARLALEDDAADIHAHPLQHLPRGIGLAEAAVVQAEAAAGIDQLRLGIAAREIGKGDEALRMIVDSGLAPLGGEQCADRAPKHDDPVDMLGELRQGRKAVLQRPQEPVPDRQCGDDNHQQGKEDDDPAPQAPPAGKQQHHPQQREQGQQVPWLGQEPEGLRQGIDQAGHLFGQRRHQMLSSTQRI